MAQKAGIEAMLASAKSSPWKVGEVTSGREDNRRFARLSYRYEAPQVEEGIIGSRLRYGTYVAHGIQLGDVVHIEQRTGFHRESQRGVLSWTIQEVATTLEVGAMMINGKPHIYVYDSAEDLRDAFHDVHPREYQDILQKIFFRMRQIPNILVKHWN